MYLKPRLFLSLYKQLMQYKIGFMLFYKFKLVHYKKTLICWLIFKLGSGGPSPRYVSGGPSPQKTMEKRQKNKEIIFSN
jgi:hypothetical protein